MILTEISLVIQ